MKNDSAGIIINEAIRDAAAIGAKMIRLKALGTSPRRYTKTGVGAIMSRSPSAA